MTCEPVASTEILSWPTMARQSASEARAPPAEKWIERKPGWAGGSFPGLCDNARVGACGVPVKRSGLVTHAVFPRC